MSTIFPKKFIQDVFIDELGQLIEKHPYISFMVMGIGLEFLGKCIDKDLTEWNKTGRSAKDFNDSLRKIPSLKKYEPFIEKYDIYSAFRCGLLHAAVPKQAVTLSSKNERAHLVESNNRLNLKVEDFYADFKSACEYVISENFESNNKMELPLLAVPGFEFNSGTDIESGATHSIA